MVDGDGGVGGAVCGEHAVIIKFLPFSEGIVAEEGVARDDVPKWAHFYLPVSPSAPPKRMALSFPMGVIVCPKRAEGLSPVKSAFSILYIKYDEHSNNISQT